MLLGVAGWLILRYVPPKLSAELIVEKADMGIPGVSKVYHAKITNRGIRPVWVSRCDFVDDAMQRGTELAYEVERWDTSAKLWVKSDFSRPDSFCKPYPLGIVEARQRGGWLWPAMSLSTNEEATAARDTSHIGDHVRFVIFIAAPGDYAHSLTTQEVVIDEAYRESVPLRLSH
jgi:hypothetical protein